MSRLLKTAGPTDTTDMSSVRRILIPALLALTLIAATPAPARADITGFLGGIRRTATGSTASTSTYGMHGISIGIGLLVVGFEVEGALQQEDTVKKISGLKTGMANILVQTPTSSAQLYATAGAGIYQESASLITNTDLATNIGGGVKIGITGPLRLRIDYRLIHFRDKASDDYVHRLYVGANIKF